MSQPVTRLRRIGAMALTLAILALGAGCGSDSDPTANQGGGTLEGFAITPATTGKDLKNRVSEAEASCVRQAIGDSEYETFLGFNLLETGAEAARALECSPAASPSKPMFAPSHPS